MSKFKRDKPIYRQLSNEVDAKLEGEIRKKYNFGTPLNREARRRQDKKIGKIKGKLNIKLTSSPTSIKVVSPDSPEYFREDS